MISRLYESIFTDNNSPSTSTVSSKSSEVPTTDDTLEGELNATESITVPSFCDINSTECGNFSTELINVTTTSLPASTTSTPERRKLERRKFKNNELCFCDLELNICDLNCCCDQDCSQNDKLVFSHCETETHTYDTRYCSYVKHMYVNNTPFELQVNQNGLFCVLKSNFPASYIVQREEPLLTFSAAEKEQLGKFSWTKHTKPPDIQFNVSEKFVQGSNVWIVTKKGIDKLVIPRKFFTNRCESSQEVENLKNKHSQCLQTDIDRDNNYLNLKSYFEGQYVITAPKHVNLTNYRRGIFQDCPRNICLAITPKICEEHFTNCKNISQNDTRLSITCNLDIRHNQTVCKNLVKRIEYKLYYNGSEGYKKIEVLTELASIIYDFDDKSTEFEQEFLVSFWWLNQTRNLSALQSGNPGYLIGKPLKIGKMVNIGNSTHIKLKIKRNPYDYRSNFLTLPENFDGNCILNNFTFYPIEFGYNVLRRCKIKSQVVNTKRNINGTEICRNIQAEILRMWNADNENTTVGMFGNSNVSRLEEWWKILYKTPPFVVLNSTKGKFDTKLNQTKCFGLISNIIISIFHSRIEVGTLRNQEKILGVTFAFGGFVNKTFSYQRNITKFDLDLKHEVVFYDISTEKRRKFVDPPGIDIKLPYDFFYPFVKLNNGVDSFKILHVCWLIVVGLVLIIF
ncbi:unnamed protein product [Acanthoscelides obtectus]|uniref:Tectonic-1 n=1 Tax=Acanthoscelides obtectus TaxID=200917 RepID=A0A9P0PK94_ACAOB|nr:unnamed protein product [Acanthoscelides obtectus]CAK1640493.1 Tectonic-3 [Acanthoscelides obtectus]